MNPEPSSEKTTCPAGPEPQAQDVVVAHGPLHQAVEGRDLGRAQASAEGTAVEDGLDGGLGHEHGFGSSFGDPPLRGLGAVPAAKTRPRSTTGIAVISA